MNEMQVLRSVPIKLSELSTTPESEVPAAVQLLRVGTFHHPEYGTFEITAQHLADMVKNWKAKVRGVDVAIDYAHESNKVAAAWIDDLYLGGENNTSELWARPKWTPNGKQKLIDREYRYLSADFSFDYQDNETLTKYGPVLLGAGLTNRPVVKNMAPAIELSEGKDLSMDPKDKEIADLKAQVAALQAEKAKGGAPASDDTELADLKKKLAETEAKCAAMEGDKQKADQAKALAEKTTSFNKLLSEGKVVEAQRDAFISGDAVKLAELSQPVKLGNKGHGNEGTGAKGDDAKATNKDEATKKILELAEVRVKNKESSDLGSAISAVRAANPDLVKLCE